MSNDTYSAPVKRERQDFLKRRTEELNSRLNRFLNHPLDSIELHGLAEELVGLSESYRAASEKSVAEHQDGLRHCVVIATPIGDTIHHADRNVPGRYNEIWASTEDEALDQFHETEPVKVLEDFEFTVEMGK